MMENMGNFDGWGMGFGWIFMLIFWGLIILGIVALGKWVLNSSAHNGSTKRTPLETLQLRYANGEIDKEEFEQRKHDLEQ